MAVSVIRNAFGQFVSVAAVVAAMRDTTAWFEDEHRAEIVAAFGGDDEVEALLAIGEQFVSEFRTDDPEIAFRNAAIDNCPLDGTYDEYDIDVAVARGTITITVEGFYV